MNERDRQAIERIERQRTQVRHDLSRMTGNDPYNPRPLQEELMAQAEYDATRSGTGSEDTTSRTVQEDLIALYGHGENEKPSSSQPSINRFDEIARRRIVNTDKPDLSQVRSQLQRILHDD